MRGFTQVREAVLRPEPDTLKAWRHDLWRREREFRLLCASNHNTERQPVNAWTYDQAVSMVDEENGDLFVQLEQTRSSYVIDRADFELTVAECCRLIEPGKQWAHWLVRVSVGPG